MDMFDVTMLATAVGIAFVHTALGPDHYVPFVALARARGWTLRRTLWITAACGVGHVASSLVLGGLGLAAGVAIGSLDTVEAHRGTVAAWLLFGIGIAYALWGVRHALRDGRGHTHLLGGGHHVHAQMGELTPGTGLRPLAPMPAGAAAARRSTTTFWTLFLVFVLGPCEPLIPLFVAPASQGHWGTVAAIGVVFGAVTLATMLTITGLAVAGLAHLPLGRLQRWTHMFAGGAIAASASAVLFLGV